MKKILLLFLFFLPGKFAYTQNATLLTDTQKSLLNRLSDTLACRLSDNLLANNDKVLNELFLAARLSTPSTLNIMISNIVNTENKNSVLSYYLMQSLVSALSNYLNEKNAQKNLRNILHFNVYAQNPVYRDTSGILLELKYSLTDNEFMLTSVNLVLKRGNNEYTRGLNNVTVQGDFSTLKPLDEQTNEALVGSFLNILNSAPQGNDLILYQRIYNATTGELVEPANDVYEINTVDIFMLKFRLKQAKYAYLFSYQVRPSVIYLLTPLEEEDNKPVKQPYCSFKATELNNRELIYVIFTDTKLSLDFLIKDRENFVYSGSLPLDDPAKIQYLKVLFENKNFIARKIKLTNK